MSTPRSVAETDIPVDVQQHPSPRDRRDQFMFSALVDRFDNNHASVPVYNPAAPPALHCHFATPGTGPRNLLSPDLGTTVIGVGGRLVLPVEVDQHRIAICHRR